MGEQLRAWCSFASYRLCGLGQASLSLQPQCGHYRMERSLGPLISEGVRKVRMGMAVKVLACLVRAWSVGVRHGM